MKLSKKTILVLIPVLIAIIIAGYFGFVQYSKNVKLNVTQKAETAKQDISSAFKGEKDGKKISGEEKINIFKSSVTDLEKYILINPNDKDALLQIAAVYYNLGNYDKSISYYQKLIALEPDVAINYTNMAHAYLAAGKNDLAKENYQKSIDMGLNNSVNYVGLSMILKEEGNIEEAKKVLEKGLEFNKNDSMIESFLEGIK
ncbi:MAG TPA: tetratricopeptide repeat protein [Patescibacteria group bacterium]|nr:tetratricopeptide repeat protein [Patescibacteria group bacterium]